MIRRREAALGLAGLVAGCAAPRYPAPIVRVDPPARWRTELAPGAPIRADWWAGFGDPLLTSLVERALAANPDVAIAASRVEEARAQLRLARAQLNPSLDLGGGVSEARAVNAFGEPTTTLGSQPLASAAYDLDLFGRLRLASAAARAQLLATGAAQDAVRLATAASAASGYLTLRGLDARAEVARATVEARGVALRIARRRATSGYTSNLELRQAEAEFAGTEQLASQAALAVARAENALNLLLGAEPATPVRGLPLDGIATPPIPDGLPTDLLRRRPDLRQAEETLVASDRSLESARAAFLPNVRLTGSVGLALSSALADPAFIFSIGPSLATPLFSGGRLEAQARASAARRDQALYAYRRAALAAFREVEDALAGVTRGAEQVAALSRQRDALAAALRNAANRYRAGYSSYLEQLDAQRGLLSAELTLIAARTDRLTAFTSLYQAMGGGWRPGASSLGPA